MSIPEGVVSPEIQAEIFLLPSTVGGREGPILQGVYRGVLSVAAGHFSVRFLVPQAPGLSPGQAATVGIQFLVPEVALKHFPPEAEFAVWEGRTIGTGRVVAIMKPTESEK